ncbi:MAG TPA: PQQ-binding-like beta-propeller repeat protein [Chloroflexota bacterium]|nr:PQQ-binding-like beta-propeller repeat protein [Chloroflexota bacterium]HUM67500.1 PQQ-binding-like beta-propeller repeat protein [Chloroflexota bacterium]
MDTQFKFARQTMMVLLGIVLLTPGCTQAGTAIPEKTGEPEPTPMTELEEPAQAHLPPTALLPEPTEAPTPTVETAAGERLWAFKPGSASEPPYWVSPLTSATAVNGVVYVGASDLPGGKRGSLHALDAGDGSLLWSYDHNGHTPSTPTVADGVVYFGSEDHHVYAVDALDGTLLWAYTTGGHVRSQPAVYETLVFVNSQDGYLYALDATDGTLQWRFQFDEPVSDMDSSGSLPSSPAVDHGAVFIAGSDHILHAINIADGVLRWEYQVDGQVFGSPRASNGIVYVGSLNRRLSALNATDGSLLWSIRMPGGIVSTPLVDAGTLYATSSVVAALDAYNGLPLWEYDPELRVPLGSPVIDGQHLYLASASGRLFVLDKGDGALLATYDLEKQPGTKAPGVANGVMYVVTKDRFLYAVRLIVSQGENP